MVSSYILKNVIVVDWSVDFNGMSTRLGLFYVSFGNNVHFKIMSIFFCWYFLRASVLVILFQVFLSNTNNLHTVVWFYVFLSNINNLHSYMVSGIPIWYFFYMVSSNNSYLFVYTQLYGFKYSYLILIYSSL